MVSGNTVFLVESTGDLTALDLGTGELRWQKTIGYPGTYGGTAAVAYGYVYSVFVSDYDTLTLSAVDELTGETAWSQDYSIGSAIASLTTPVVDSGMVFWSELESGTVHANDALTGEELWAYGSGGWMYQGPTYWAGMVFASNEYGSVTALDAFSGEVLWTTNVVGAVLAAPTIADGVMYIGDMNGALVAFDPFTGEELWRNSTGLFLAGASPLVADGIVFACAVNPYSYESSVMAFDATTGDGDLEQCPHDGICVLVPSVQQRDDLLHVRERESVCARRGDWRHRTVHRCHRLLHVLAGHCERTSDRDRRRRDGLHLQLPGCRLRDERGDRPRSTGAGGCHRASWSAPRPTMPTAARPRTRCSPGNRPAGSGQSCQSQETATRSSMWRARMRARTRSSAPAAD